MDEQVSEHHRHKHWHKVRRVRRRTGLTREGYLLFALALLGCMALVSLFLWLINRSHHLFG